MEFKIRIISGSSVAEAHIEDGPKRAGMKVSVDQELGDEQSLSAHLRMVINNLESVLAIIDLNGSILFLSEFPPTFHCLVDTPLERGMSLFDAIPQEAHYVGRSMISKVVASRSQASVTVERTSENGVRYFFELRCKAIGEHGSEPNELLVEVLDVTPQRVFEKKMKALATELSQLIENANAVIIGTDSRGYITEWNKVSSKISGFTKADALAKRLPELLIEEKHWADFHNAFSSVLEGGMLTNHELPVRSQDGRSLTILTNATPKRNATGSIIGMLMVGQDITELIEYRRSLERMVDDRTEELNRSNSEIKEQQTLVEAQRKESDRLLLNILPEPIARELKGKGHVVPRLYKLASVLFADLVGFTALARGLTPETMLYELNYIFTGFDMILERYNLEKIKTMGDGYMAVGGIPEENDTNPRDSVIAALKMVEFIEWINKENTKSGKPAWQIRIGINTGEVVAGVIGKNKFAYDVWGASVNAASRIEFAGEAGKVNISETTYNLVKDKFQCVHRGSIKVKNMGMMNMYFVDREAEADRKDTAHKESKE